MFAFTYIGLFVDSPVSLRTCLGVRLYLHELVGLYLHGLVWVFTFTIIGLFGCSHVSTWTCRVVLLYLNRLMVLFAFKYIGLCGCSPLSAFACLVDCLYLHWLVIFCLPLSSLICFGVRLCLHWLVLLFPFIYMDLFCCFTLSTWTSSVVFLYLHGIFWLFSCNYMDLFGRSPLFFWIIYLISTLFLLCFSTHLFIDAFWSPAGRGPTSWLSFVMSNCEDITFLLVSWVRRGASLYGFLIFAFFLTLVCCLSLSTWDLFDCSLLSSWTCLGVRFCLYGLVWFFAFIFMDLFGFSPIYMD